MYTYTACPTQADDIAHISPSARNMQDMPVMCENYSYKWRFTFSSPKSQIINFSRERYNKQLLKSTSTEHEGIKLHANFDHWERIAEACKSIKSTSMALLQSGCHPHGLSPVTSLKRVKTLRLAKSLYRCELWNALLRNELLALERAFRFSIKNIQCLPKRTRTNICLGVNRYHLYRINNRHAQVFFPGSPPSNFDLDISIQSGNKSVNTFFNTSKFPSKDTCK